MDRSNSERVKAVLEAVIQLADSCEVSRAEVKNILNEALEERPFPEAAGSKTVPVAHSMFVSELLFRWTAENEFTDSAKAEPVPLRLFGPGQTLEELYNRTLERCESWLPVPSLGEVIALLRKASGVKMSGDDVVKFPGSRFPFFDDADAGGDSRLQSLAEYSSTLVGEPERQAESRMVSTARIVGVDIERIETFQTSFRTSIREAIEIGYMMLDNSRTEGAVEKGGSTVVSLGGFYSVTRG